MARPLRLQFPGALYHVTARGNAHHKIFLDEDDRHSFLALLGKEIGQQRWIRYAYCLMDNHYHLLLETPEPNLVAGMQRLSARAAGGAAARSTHAVRSIAARLGQEIDSRIMTARAS